MLPDDGDHTVPCWSHFNANFDTPFTNDSLVHQLVARCTVRMWKEKCHRNVHRREKIIFCNMFDLLCINQVSSKPAGLPADNAGRCLTDRPHPLINMQMTLIDMQIT